MMLKDYWIAAWLGDAARMLHYPLPLVLGIVLTALGWWWSQPRAAGAHGHRAR
jgi:hypothetical protein